MELTDTAAFAPQFDPFPNSSDTPPEDSSIDLPEPPEDKKIARKRDSMRYPRNIVPESPDPPAKRPKTSSHASPGRPRGTAASVGRVEPSRERGRTMELDGLRTDLAADVGSSSRADVGDGNRNGAFQTPKVDYLSFSVSARPRPSMPRPTSPPRFSFATPSTSMSVPRGTDRRVRKSLMKEQRATRDSMWGVHDESLIVDVPERETPMIKKNRELREQQRRSSLGSRGQRASESMDNGDISESRLHC